MCPGPQGVLCAVLGGGGERLEVDDPCGGVPGVRSDGVEGRELGEALAAAVEHRDEVAAVVVLAAMAVVVLVRGAVMERDQQRLVELLGVGDRIGARLLGERVEVVVGGLVGDQRAHCPAAPAGRGECREQRGAFDVPPLGERLQSGVSQAAARDALCCSAPVRKLARDRGCG